MEASFRLIYLWHDVDVYQLQVAASNGYFSASARAYVPVGGLRECAEQLSGFPRSWQDRREIEFGNFGREFSGGAARLSFSCYSRAGHPVVEFSIEDEASQLKGSAAERSVQSAHFFANVDPASVDLFAAQLRQLEVEQHGFAELKVHPQG